MRILYCATNLQQAFSCKKELALTSPVQAELVLTSALPRWVLQGSVRDPSKPWALSTASMDSLKHADCSWGFTRAARHFICNLSTHHDANGRAGYCKGQRLRCAGPGESGQCEQAPGVCRAALRRASGAQNRRTVLSACSQGCAEVANGISVPPTATAVPAAGQHILYMALTNKTTSVRKINRKVNSRRCRR